MAAERSRSDSNLGKKEVCVNNISRINLSLYS